MSRLIYLLAVLLIIACKKTETKSPIGGYWAGTGLAKGTAVSEFLGFLYNNDGTIRAYDANDTTAANKLNGTFSLDTDSVRTIVVNGGSVTEFSAALNSASTQMYGTFRRTTGSYSGTYSVTKR